MSLPLKKDTRNAPPLSGPLTPAEEPARRPKDARPAAPGGGRQAAAVIVVLALLLISAAWFLQPPRPGNGGGSGPEKGWNLFLDLKGDRTFSGQDLEIFGDVIVRKGARLRFIDCNVTVNGTFYVQGNISFLRGRLAPYPAVQYYQFHGDAPDRLSLSFDLTDCNRASLRFATRHCFTPGESMAVNVFSDGEWHNRMLVLKGAPHRIMSHSLELSRFCGGPVKVEFTPDMVANGSRTFQLFDLEVETDRGAFPSGAIDIEVPRKTWFATNSSPDYSIGAGGGAVLLDATSVISHGFGIFGSSAGIALRNATLTGTAKISASYDYYRYYSFISATCSSVEITGCRFRALSTVRANDSVVSIERTKVSYGSTVVDVQNTDLDVRECDFDHFTVGILAVVDQDLGRGTLAVRDSALSDCEYGVQLGNQSGTVRGCDISARYPFYIKPPRSMARPDCTARAILSLNESRITVNATPGESGNFGVQAYSAFPILGVYDWFRSNEWNATCLYKRAVVVAYQERNAQTYQYGAVSYRGREETMTLGPGFEPGNLSVREIGPTAVTRQYPSLEPWYRQGPLDLRIIDTESLVIAGDAIYHNRTDESRLNFSLVTYDGMAFLDKDLGALSSPSEVLWLGFSLMPVCDVSVRSLRLSRDPGSERLSLYVSFWTEGLSYNYENAISVLVGGRQLVYDTTGSRRYYLDPLQVQKGGNLTVKVIPLGVEDLDLSDNVASVRMGVFDTSCELAGPQDLAGYWVLKPGVDLTLRECQLRATGGDAAIIGMGRNRFMLECSTVEYDGLRINVSRAGIAGSDLLPRGGGTLELAVDDLTVDDATFGCRRQDYAGRLAQLETELAASPDGMLPASHWYDAAGYNLRTVCTFKASEIKVNASRFIDCYDLSVLATGKGAISNCELAFGDTIGASSGDLMLDNNSIGSFRQVYMIGPETVLLNNSLEDVPDGLRLSDETVNLTATGNSFLISRRNLSATVALEAWAGARLDIRGNEIAGYQNGIYLYCDGEPRDLFRNNTFLGITNASVARWKQFTYNMYPATLGINYSREPYVRALTIAWTDLFQDHNETVNGWVSYSSGEKYMYADLEFVDSLVDSAGAGRGLDRLVLRISLSRSDGTGEVFERTVFAPKEHQWTETLE